MIVWNFAKSVKDIGSIVRWHASDIDLKLASLHEVALRRALTGITQYVCDNPALVKGLVCVW